MSAAGSVEFRECAIATDFQKAALGFQQARRRGSALARRAFSPMLHPSRHLADPAEQILDQVGFDESTPLRSRGASITLDVLHSFDDMTAPMNILLILSHLIFSVLGRRLARGSQG